MVEGVGEWWKEEENYRRKRKGTFETRKERERARKMEEGGGEQVVAASWCARVVAASLHAYMPEYVQCGDEAKREHHVAAPRIVAGNIIYVNARPKLFGPRQHLHPSVVFAVTHGNRIRPKHVHVASDVHCRRSAVGNVEWERCNVQRTRLASHCLFLEEGGGGGWAA